MFDKFFSNKSSKAHEKVTKDYDELIKIIDAFNGSMNLAINKEKLMAFPIGVWVSLNEKVKVRRRKHRFKNHLNFDTIMEAGGEFGKHFHDDVVESAEILYGELHDLEDDKIYKKGDVVEYDKGIRHTPIATIKTRLHVLFKP